MTTYEKSMLSIVTLGFAITIALLLEIYQQTYDIWINGWNIRDMLEFITEKQADYHLEQSEG